MKRLIFLALTACLLVAPAFGAAKDTAATSPTYYADVLPVLQQNCQVCHREGGANLGGMVAPMAFTSYQDTRPWARSIAKQVEAELMPPWHASHDFDGVFANERLLSDEDRATLIQWAKAGAPAGDAADAPAPLEWADTGGWSIGTPDLVLDMGTDYFVEDDVEDKYVYFETEITEEQMPKPRWIKAIEFRPGSEVVHHIITRPLGGIAPGNTPTINPEGFATRIKPGTKLTWQMHYHKEPGPGTGVMDRSYVALKFYPEDYEPQYIVQNEPLTRFDFEIPPGDANYTQTVTTTFERDSIILGYTPHMHLRGKSARYVAKYPDGTEEVLLDVPRYDFNWQTTYEYPEGGKTIPAGTELELTMSWDNSADNPYNPDPSQTVVFGEPTTAEMMFGFVNFADAEPGYQPVSRGLFSQEGEREFDPEAMKKILKDRFNIDWDTLSDEERQQMIERFQNRRREAQAEAVSGL
ncbi:MAG: hypothetical protein R3190_02515 [Thermoanaerobaculia bacterium]|nr:hypothetical protein [Thermoanaerobaculia bacterium]